jgi:hypothetical protein
VGAFLKFVLGLLVPPDPCPWDLIPGAQDQEKIEEVKRAMRRWQIGVSSVLAATIIVLAGSVATPYGFALAGDSNNKTAVAVKPLSEAVAKIQEDLKANEAVNTQMLAMLNELRAVDVANGIDRLIRRRCIETDPDELRQLRRDIEDQKVVFRSLANREYSEPSCAEVIRN